MKQPIYDTGKISIFYNGLFTEPRLNHAEGIALDNEGNVWCGGETGELYRIARDGSDLQLVASTGGFILGVTVDARNRVYLCDMKFGCVYRYDPADGQLVLFASGNEGRSISCPNYAVVDEAHRWLYVSDSQENGPGIWRFHIDTGEGELWYDKPCSFANGLALSSDSRTLYVAESFESKVSRIAIGDDGRALSKEDVVIIPDTVPDGLLLHPDGRLYISCFEPSAVYRYTMGGDLELLVHDKQAQVLDHPSNMALTQDGILLLSNLGAWHLSALDLKLKP